MKSRHASIGPRGRLSTNQRNESHDQGQTALAFPVHFAFRIRYMRERKKSVAGRVKGLILLCVMLPLGLYGIGLAFLMLVAAFTSATDDKDERDERERQSKTLSEQQREAFLKEREERREDKAREAVRIKLKAASDAAAVEASARAYREELNRQRLKERLAAVEEEKHKE